MGSSRGDIVVYKQLLLLPSELQQRLEFLLIKGHQRVHPRVLFDKSLGLHFKEGFDLLALLAEHVYGYGQGEVLYVAHL